MLEFTFGRSRDVRTAKGMCYALLAIGLLTVAAGAQQEDRRGFVGLGIGPSLPLGGFRDDSPTNLRGGRARTGYTDTLVNLGYRFRERLGVAVALSYSEYPMRGVGDDDWWQVAAVTAGPMYSIPLNTRTALELKAMAGIVVLTPVEDGYTTDDGVGTGVGVDLRAALRYDLARRWALFAEGGVQASGASFSSGARTDYRAVISGFGVAFRPAW